MAERKIGTMSRAQLHALHMAHACLNNAADQNRQALDYFILAGYPRTHPIVEVLQVLLGEGKQRRTA